MIDPISSTNPQLNAAFEMLRSKGVKEYQFAPLLWRMLWKREKLVPPPQMMEFGTLAWIAGLYFGTAMGLAVFVITSLSFPDYAWLIALAEAPLMGLAYGPTVAWLAGRQRRKHDIPLWKDFVSE